MPAPAILAALDALAARVAQLAPASKPSVPFRQLKEAPLDPFDLPVDGCERRFFLRFDGLDDRTGAGGVVTFGRTDRTARVSLVVTYPVVSKGELDRQLAADAEVLHRGLGRWAADPIQLVTVASARADSPDAQMVAITHTLGVQYRDAE